MAEKDQETTEKRGFFGKIKEKYDAHQETVKQRKQEELERAIKEELGALNIAMSKCLKDVTSTQVEYKLLDIGSSLVGAAAGFTTNDDVPIVSYVMVRWVETHPPSSGAKLRAYPFQFIFGSFADRPIPISVITKKVKTSHFSSSRVLIPFQIQPNSKFDAETIWKNKINWVPLIDIMNKDQRLLLRLGAVNNAGNVSISSKSWISWNIEDGKPRDLQCICQIIPYEKLTYFGIRSIVFPGETRSAGEDVKNIVDVLRTIRGHVLTHSHETPVNGQIAEDWIKIPIGLFQGGFYKPTATEEYTAARAREVTPRVGVKYCIQCGELIPEVAVYCPRCASKQEQ